MGMVATRFSVDDDVYYYIGERLRLEGETENMGVCTKGRKGMMTAEVRGLSALGWVMMLLITMLGLCQTEHRSDTDGDPFANPRCLCMDR